MFLERLAEAGFPSLLPPRRREAAGRPRLFLAAKRGFDVALSLGLLPFLLAIAALLWLLNPHLNRGPVFFLQRRMGRGCRPFTAIKFRSMRPAPQSCRGAAEPLEADRIPPLGRLLRRSRIDELPQILNVLRGEMSLIGPRPDALAHAEEYLRTIPGYRERHVLRPGISGLAQTEIGYVQGAEETRRKVAVDLHYIAHAGFALDSYIFLRTLQTVLGRHGL